MQAFAHVVEQVSFSKASATMGVGTPTITRHIQQLENYLGVVLLNRTTRRLSLTPDGLHYYDYCKRILADVQRAEKTLPGATQSLRGKLRVDISHALARQVILPAVSGFIERYPQIQLTIGLDDRIASLIQENIDCAIRIGIPQDSNFLIARRLASVEWITCASPRYLQKHGTPVQLRDLTRHQAVGYCHPQSGKYQEWSFVCNDEPVSVEMSYAIAVNETSAYIGCGLDGLGLLRIPACLVQSDLDSGRLVAVLPQFASAGDPVSVVYPNGNRSSLTVRVFTDWVQALFAPSAPEGTANKASFHGSDRPLVHYSSGTAHETASSPGYNS
ncbi:LysR family transcriptional regulator [Pseudomonas sp. dw_358]|uniref:LysR substrate-binding domain-containing protein n=1 Tax=Pseudomonas sp. dw_358 TaxID=2720083 RepID=UPI001BD41301|nr:LysR family transcriptional regulator [Pseudomonas sp. dw_358]